MSKKCFYHQNNGTKKVVVFGKKKLACAIDACPYNNLKEITYGGEHIENICEVNGILENKIKILDLTKQS